MEFMKESGSRFFACNSASSGFGGVRLSVGRVEPAVGEMDSSAIMGWSVLVLCVEADESGVEADEVGEEVDEAGEAVDEAGEGAGVVDVFLRLCPGLVVVISVVLV